jgi:hypothetical protein
MPTATEMSSVLPQALGSGVRPNYSLCKWNGVGEPGIHEMDRKKANPARYCAICEALLACCAAGAFNAARTSDVPKLSPKPSEASITKSPTSTSTQPKAGTNPLTRSPTC